MHRNKIEKTYLTITISNYTENNLHHKKIMIYTSAKIALIKKVYIEKT